MDGVLWSQDVMGIDALREQTKVLMLRVRERKKKCLGEREADTYRQRDNNTCRAAGGEVKAGEVK